LAGLGLEKYSSMLEAQDLSRETLCKLTHDDLKECGVTSMGHRKAILLAIEVLKNQRTAILPSVASAHVEAKARPPLFVRIRRAYFKATGGCMLLSIGIHAVILAVGAWLVVSQVVEERKSPLMAERKDRRARSSTR